MPGEKRRAVTSPSLEGMPGGRRLGPQTLPTPPRAPSTHLMSWMRVSASEWVRRESSSRALAARLSVVNIPLTSR